jgi:hypothetical protein
MAPPTGKIPSDAAKIASCTMGLKVECLKVKSRRTANAELTFDL